MIEQCFAKLVEFAGLVDFTVNGSTITNIEEREVDTIIHLSNISENISLIYKNDGTFDNYSRQTNS